MIDKSLQGSPSYLILLLCFFFYYSYSPGRSFSHFLLSVSFASHIKCARIIYGFYYRMRAHTLLVMSMLSTLVWRCWSCLSPSTTSSFRSSSSAWQMHCVYVLSSPLPLFSVGRFLFFVCSTHEHRTETHINAIMLSLSLSLSLSRFPISLCNTCSNYMHAASGVGSYTYQMANPVCICENWEMSTIHFRFLCREWETLLVASSG